MKLRLIVIFCVGLFFVSLGVLYVAFSMFRDVAVGHRSISLIRDALQRSDHIEVQFLSTDPPTGNQKIFKTADYYDQRYTIVSSVRLDEATTKELKGILSDHTYSTQSQVACHDPGQVLRFFSGSSLLLEMSLCLHCTNVEFYAYPFFPTAVTLFDAKSKSFSKLPRIEKIMEKIKNG